MSPRLENVKDTSLPRVDTRLPNIYKRGVSLQRGRLLARLAATTAEFCVSGG